MKNVYLGLLGKTRTELHCGSCMECVANGLVKMYFHSALDLRTGYPFQRRFLERGIKTCGSRLYLLLKIVADYNKAFI